jgi:hypothetical protein
MAALAIVVVWMPALQAEQSHVTPTRHRGSTNLRSPDDFMQGLHGNPEEQRWRAYF